MFIEFIHYFFPFDTHERLLLTFPVSCKIFSNILNTHNKFTQLIQRLFTIKFHDASTIVLLPLLMNN